MPAGRPLHRRADLRATKNADLALELDRPLHHAFALAPVPPKHRELSASKSAPFAGTRPSPARARRSHHERFCRSTARPAPRPPPAARQPCAPRETPPTESHFAAASSSAPRDFGSCAASRRSAAPAPSLPQLPCFVGQSAQSQASPRRSRAPGSPPLGCHPSSPRCTHPPQSAPGTPDPDRAPGCDTPSSAPPSPSCAQAVRRQRCRSSLQAE